jgi:DNA invertase Pin-like site-specific DNA recombinase
MKAFGYTRTSSVTNSDGDSSPRQEEKILHYATGNGIEIVQIYHDVVSGTVPVEGRPAFSELLDRIESDDISIVVVEDVSRFARDMLASEISILALKERGVTCITTSGEDLTETDDPARVMMRQVAQSFAQYEKARLVAKLKGARDRASKKAGKRVEGRKSYKEINPEMVRQAKRLYRRSPKTGKRLSLRKVADKLINLGYAKPDGNPFDPKTVSNMVTT